VDFLQSGIFWAGALGLAGIIATFFAPTWTQRQAEERAEERAIRQALRLVAHELNLLSLQFGALAETGKASRQLVTEHGFLSTDEWVRQRGLLATTGFPSGWENLSRLYLQMESTRLRIAVSETRGLTDVEIAFCRRAEEEARRGSKFLTESYIVPGAWWNYGRPGRVRRLLYSFRSRVRRRGRRAAPPSSPGSS
jgi:hypothetical protein